MYTTQVSWWIFAGGCWLFANHRDGEEVSFQAIKAAIANQ